VMAECDETEQDTKRRRRYHEKIDRHKVTNVVVQESPPRLRRRLAVADLVLVDRCVRRFVAKESQLRTDSRRSPRRVLRRMRRINLRLSASILGRPGFLHRDFHRQ
jgi:hypothetical protein